MKTEKEIREQIEELKRDLREALMEPNYQDASMRDLEICQLKWVLEE